LVIDKGLEHGLVFDGTGEENNDSSDVQIPDVPFDASTPLKRLPEAMQTWINSCLSESDHSSLTFLN
jgi:hypothetical protein